MTKTQIAEKMRVFALEHNFASDHELIVKADAFDKACVGYYATPQLCSVKIFIRAWIVARKCWCSYSGEELL